MPLEYTMTLVSDSLQPVHVTTQEEFDRHEAFFAERERNGATIIRSPSHAVGYRSRCRQLTYQVCVKGYEDRKPLVSEVQVPCDPDTGEPEFEVTSEQVDKMLRERIEIDLKDLETGHWDPWAEDLGNKSLSKG